MDKNTSNNSQMQVGRITFQNGWTDRIGALEAENKSLFTEMGELILKNHELFRKIEQLKFTICKSGIQLTYYKRLAEDAANVIVCQQNTIERLKSTKDRKTDPRKTYMIRHREAGLCTRCASPATHGQMCEQHWLKYKEYKRKYRNNLITSRRDKGLCIGCGSPLDAESDAKCKCINCTEQRLRPERGKRLHENIVNNRYAR